jgi:hypothetical protein
LDFLLCRQCCKSTFNGNIRPNANLKSDKMFLKLTNIGG